MEERDDMSFYDMIQEAGRQWVKTEDPQMKESTAKSIYQISKANIEDDESAKRLELDERKVAAQEEANRLKKIELEHQDRKDERDTEVKRQQIEQNDRIQKDDLADRYS